MVNVNRQTNMSESTSTPGYSKKMVGEQPSESLAAKVYIRAVVPIVISIIWYSKVGFKYNTFSLGETHLFYDTFMPSQWHYVATGEDTWS